MIALIRLVLAVLASPFKSKSRLEAILSELRVSFRHGLSWLHCQNSRGAWSHRAAVAACPRRRVIE
jgi:hypothetical protein